MGPQVIRADGLLVSDLLQALSRYLNWTVMHRRW